MIRIKKSIGRCFTSMPWVVMSFFCLIMLNLNPPFSFDGVNKPPPTLIWRVTFYCMKEFGSEPLTDLKTLMPSPFSSMLIPSYVLATPSTSPLSMITWSIQEPTNSPSITNFKIPEGTGGMRQDIFSIETLPNDHYICMSSVKF